MTTPPKGGRRQSGANDDPIANLRAAMGSSSGSTPGAGDDDLFAEVDIPDWLNELSRQGEDIQPPSMPGAPSDPLSRLNRADAGSPADQAENIPDWLRGAAVGGPSSSDDLFWDNDIDFSDLPAWLQVEEVPPAATPAPAQKKELPDWMQRGPTPPPPAANQVATEGEGSGILLGVAGPIPVEPVIALPHRAPRYPGEVEEPREATMAENEAVALFAAIATGLRPAPVLAEEHVQRNTLPLLPLLLILAVVATLGLNRVQGGTLTSPPPNLSAPLLMASTIESVPNGGHVLVAFDYEGGRLDELEPGLLMLLEHLRGKEARILAISTTPFGPGFAQRAWTTVSATALGQAVLPLGNREGADYGDRFVNMGFLPGSEAGLRALLTVALSPNTFRAQRDVIRNQPLADFAATQGLNSIRDVKLIVVVSDEGSDVRRWLEQIGSQLPTLPIVAIVPADVEPTLIPYIASGQLRAVLAGLIPTAGYEQRFTEGRLATRRLDGLAAALVVFLLAVLAGNVMGLIQRRRKADESAPDWAVGQQATEPEPETA
jgi:hypothetical protein